MAEIQNSLFPSSEKIKKNGTKRFLKNIFSLQSLCGLLSFALILSILIIALFLWVLNQYHKQIFGDTLASFIPQETLFYSHINTNNLSGENFSWYYRLLDKKLHYGSKVNLEKEILPLADEVSFLYFSTPEGIRPAFLIKLQGSDEAREQFIELLGRIELQGKFLTRQVVVLAPLPYLEKFQQKNQEELEDRFALLSKKTSLTGFFLPKPFFDASQKKESTIPEKIIFNIFRNSASQIFFSLSDDQKNGWKIRIDDFQSGKTRKKEIPDYFLSSKLSGDLSYTVSDGASFIAQLFPDHQDVDKEFLIGALRISVRLLDNKEAIEYVLEKEAKNPKKEEVEKNLISLISQFVPIKQTLALPDGDTVTEFVRDRNGLEFRPYASSKTKDSANNNDDTENKIFQLYAGGEKKNIYFSQTGEIFSLGNSISLLESAMREREKFFQTKTALEKDFSDCQNRFSQEILILKSSIFQKFFSLDWFSPYSQIILNNMSLEGIKGEGCVR